MGDHLSVRARCQRAGCHHLRGTGSHILHRGRCDRDGFVRRSIRLKTPSVTFTVQDHGHSGRSGTRNLYVGAMIRLSLCSCRSIVLLGIPLAAVVACIIMYLRAPGYISEYGSEMGELLTIRRMGELIYSIEEHRRSTGKLPSSLSDIERDDIRDAWRRPFHYLPDGSGNFLLTSDGPDRTPDTGDDLRPNALVNADVEAEMRARRSP